MISNIKYCIFHHAIRFMKKARRNKIRKNKQILNHVEYVINS